MRAAQPIRPLAKAPSVTAGHAYRWFVGGTFTWFVAAGMQQVILSWLLVGELEVGSSWVGTIQMVATLPILALLLPAGAMADRRERRSLLILQHGLAAVGTGILALLVHRDQLSLSILVVYALAWGTLQAFAQPARDAFVSDLASANLLRGVAGLTLVQFVGVGVGSRLAALGEAIGIGAAIAMQATILLVGAIPISRLPRSRASTRHKLSVAGLREGFDHVRHTPGLAHVTLLVAANGLFFNGPFLVLCPIIIREIYDGGLGELSLIMMALPMGCIAGSLGVLARGRILHKGRAFLASLLCVAGCVLAIAFQPPIPLLVGIVFVWGIGHSLFFTVSRTLFQEAAPETHRARVLAIHPLAFLGMSPFSTLGAGLLASVIGPLAVCGLAGGAMIVITALAWRFSAIRR